MHNIACIGGGTGLFTLLSGLKKRSYNISAIVTMMDSGGSTGRLRDEFGYLPPGDVRQCLVALSDAPDDLRKLMTYRFRSAGDLAGHNLGNLILTALKDIAGGEYEAIEAMERMLNIKGKVLPVTLTSCHLVATLSDGSKIIGETNIDVPKHDPKLTIKKLELQPSAEIFSQTKEALLQADTIVLGPGDVYTSIMPNIVVDGFLDALKETKAKIIYVVNTMTKHGETAGFTAQKFVDHMKETLDGVHIDAIIVNTGNISEEQEAAYMQEQATPVKNDLQEGIIITGDLVNKEAFARHNSKALADAVEEAIKKCAG
ncbi:MAG: YvcK family protein [Candidatus Woesearchaeota archaeon]|nr:YvcK family protein [Candidatus Woesearchaeota archaeon]